MFKNLSIDLQKDLFDFRVQFFIHERVDCHKAGHRHIVEQPHKPYIRLTQLFYLPHGDISVLHKRKQYNFQ